MRKVRYKEFARKLQELTEASGNSLTQIAEDIGVSVVAYYGWLQATRFPNVENLLALCWYFGVDPNDMLNWEYYMLDQEFELEPEDDDES